MRKVINEPDDLIQMFEGLRSRAVKQDGSTGPNQSRTYNCEKCRDEEGVLVRDEDGYERWRFCECRELKRVERLFSSSQITEAYQKLGFKNFRTQGRPQPIVDAYTCASTYFKNFHEIKEQRQNSIALLGVPGSGKTHLLMAVANNLLRQGVGVIYFPWVEGFNELKDNLDNLDFRIHQLQKVPVLFIDDLFKGRKIPTEFQTEQLFAIVNYRYLNNLPMLVSSERDIDELCEIDTATGSRIYEMARDYCVIMKGGSELNYRIVGAAG